MVDWKDIRFFHEVVVHGSFSAAARATGSTQATISRRIQALEAQLGQGLFLRGQEGSELTEIGGKLKAAAEKMHSAYEEFEKQTEEITSGTQTLVVTCGSLIGLHLSKHIGRLYEGLKNVEIEIKTTSDFLDLEKGEADLALRNQRPEKGLVKARKVRSSEYGQFSVFGSARFFREGQFGSLEELRQQKWIGHAKRLSQVPTARWIRKNIGDTQVRFRMNTTNLILEAATQNDALALLPRFIGRATPDLVEVFGPLEDFIFEMWMVRRENSDADENLLKLMGSIEKLFTDLKEKN